MKKILLFITLVFVPILAKAQLVMTPEGLVNEIDGKDFLVIDADGTRTQLFNKSMTYLQGIFNSPNHALSSVEGQSITVNGFSENEVESKLKRNFATRLDLRYSITFEFKDGKVRSKINHWQAGQIVPLGNFKVKNFVHGIFDSDLSIMDQRAKDSLESYFNRFFLAYQNALKFAEEW